MIISKHRWCILYMRERRFLAEVGETEKSFPIFGKTYIALVRCRYFVSLFANVFRKEKITNKNLLVEVLCCCILIAVDFHKSRWNFKLLSTPESAQNHEGTNIFISMKIKMTLSIKSTMHSTNVVLWVVPKISLAQSWINIWKIVRGLSWDRSMGFGNASLTSHRIAWMVDKLFCSFFSWIFKIYTFSATIDWPFRKF